MSHLSSQHHSFDISLAARYGIEKAILIHHFQHWIRFNRHKKKNIKEGRCWSYQTREDITGHFPYFTFDSVRHHMEALVKMGILLQANYNKIKIDKTLWYAFKDERLFGVDEQSIKEMFTKGENPSREGENPFPEGENPTPIPDTIHTDTIHTDKNSLLSGLPVTSAPEREKLPKREVAKKEAALEALELANRLKHESSQVMTPTRPPNVKEWALEIERINRIDGKTWDEIREMINWAMEDPFWCKQIRSAANLRKHWDKMAIKRIPVNSKAAWKEKNKEIASEMKHVLEKNNRSKEMRIYPDGIFCVPVKESVDYNLPTEQFEKIMIKLFNLRIMNE